MMLAKYPHVHIDTISYCNSKCIFCGYHNMRRAKGIMPRELFNKIIDEIATWDTKISVNPHHYGEFFLHPEWFELLKYIQDKAPKTDITIATNASVLDDAKLDKLLTIKNLNSICFSAYSDNPDTYTKIIGLPPENLNKIEHAVYRLWKERPDVEIVLGVTPALLTDGEYTSFIDHWMKQDIHLKIVPHPIINMHTNSSSISSGCMEPCPDLFDILVVLHNGDTCGCQIDLDGENYFGNAYKNSLLEIWNGEHANDYRNMHLQNKRDESPLCRSCTRPCDIKIFKFLDKYHTRTCVLGDEKTMNEIPFFFQQKNNPIIPGRLSMLRLFTFGKIIDVGCGLGTTFGDKATNLDKLPNEEMKAIVKKQDPGLYAWFKLLFPDEKTANYVQADATKHIPFEDKIFDCAVLSEVLEHLNETDTQAMLKEAGRVADYVIISVPNEWEWPEEIAFNKNVPGEARLGEGVWTGHITFHTQETIKKAVENAGMSMLLYLKVNIARVSHHVMVATNTPMAPINYRWGMGYGLGSMNQGMPVTIDEIVSFVPISKLQKEEKKLNTNKGM